MSLSKEQQKKLYDDDSLDTAHKQSYDSRDAGGYKDIFDRSKCTGITFWKPASTEHLVDFLPWFCGPNYPYVQGIKLPEGTPTYLVDVYVHRGVGANEDQYVCLAKSYGKACPICEYRSSSPDLSAEEIESLRPKRRTVYAVWDRDNESKGVQIWEVAHWYMEKKLQYRAKRPRGGGYVNYSHPKRGKSVAFTIVAKGEFKDYDGHDFVDRDEPIPVEILSSVPCVDDLIYTPSYKEVKEVFFSGLSKGDGEEAIEERSSESTIDTHQEEKIKDIDTKISICPIGVNFGKDFNEYEDCDECVVKIECQAKNQELEEQKTPTPPRRRRS
jgi:hypothetical protein